MVVSGIGSWYMCLEAMGYLATLTNCCLMVLMGDSLTGLVPASMSSLLERTEGKIILALVLEHVLLAVKFAVGEFVDDEPMWVKEAVAKEQIEQQRATRELRLTAHKMQLPEKKLAAAAADPEEDLDEDAVDDSTNSFEKAPKSTIWKFSPLWYAPLICVPYVIGAFGLRGAWVLPLAAMLIGYMKRRKDTSDLGMAIGVVSDAQLLKLITKELPFWFYGTDVERVEWMNKLLQQMWPHATGAAIVIVKTIVEPMLEEYKPPGVTTLKFQKVFLGTFAPRVIGVRTINTSSNTATLEMEVRPERCCMHQRSRALLRSITRPRSSNFNMHATAWGAFKYMVKWAGDPKFVVEVGRAMMPLTVTLSKIRFSGKLRAELSPLMPKIPCFGALAVTFMERPFIDFTFKVGSLDVMSIGSGDMSVAAAMSAIMKSLTHPLTHLFLPQVGSLDVMSIGPGDMSVAAAVSAIIKSTIQSMMLYPKKLVIPMVDGVDVGPLENPSPKGVLQLHIIGANKLKKADIVGKSDPYVVVKLGEEEVKTKVMNNTLDPRWDQQFDLLVHDKSVQVLTLAVFDEDVGDDELLGTCEIHLSRAGTSIFPQRAVVHFNRCARLATLTCRSVRAALPAASHWVSRYRVADTTVCINVLPPQPAGMPDIEDVDEEDLDFDEPLFGYDEGGEESDGDGDAETVADSVAGAAGADGGERDALLQRSKPGKLSPAKVAKKSGKKIKGAFKAIKGAVHLSHGPDSPDSKKAAAAAEQAAAAAQGAGGGGAATALRQSLLAAPSEVDASMGVLTLMNVQVKGAKPAKYYCKIRIGDFKRSTAPAPKGGDAAWPLIFHTLVKQSKSAFILVKVYADAALLGDDLYGTVTVNIADIIVGGCDVQQDWPIQGGRAQGAVSFRDSHPSPCHCGTTTLDGIGRLRCGRRRFREAAAQLVFSF
ncbi:hypothetical protein JKP88DRAFT_264267 [Tribonema minus]|uniref:C2 domain-containing protein n=1 Tax=Tribonema minus TaxID=303371 RepID=A0A835YTN3_9STRA|nr:hypothetical protein JKP88DRAFT_264267 [Tribonema minus]